jgi:hypothetical protein
MAAAADPAADRYWTAGRASAVAKLATTRAAEKKNVLSIEKPSVAELSPRYLLGT